MTAKNAADVGKKSKAKTVIVVDISGHFRRLAKDFEILPATAENMARRHAENYPCKRYGFIRTSN